MGHENEQVIPFHPLSGDARSLALALRHADEARGSTGPVALHGISGITTGLEFAGCGWIATGGDALCHGDGFTERHDQHSLTSAPLGWLAKAEIDSFQSKAKDPAVFIPSVVNDAEVFYQHTLASQSHGVNSGIYNLWGELPVKGPAHYYNLTAAGAIHHSLASGHYRAVVMSFSRALRTRRGLTIIPTVPMEASSSRSRLVQSEADRNASAKSTRKKHLPPRRLAPAKPTAFSGR